MAFHVRGVRGATRDDAGRGSRVRKLKRSRILNFLVDTIPEEEKKRSVREI